MLGWFPTPYPDELLYSICARYQEQVAYPSLHAVTEELFGDWYKAPVVDLPCHLDRLVSALPAGHYLTVDRLIDNHTLLPFYSPFLPADRIDRIRNEMGYKDCRIVHKFAGIHRSSVRTPDRLRFCPMCVKEDRDKFDCTYWHRSHQLPGIEVCPDHAVFLENSHAPTRSLRAGDGYIAAEQAVADSLPRPINLSDSTHAIQLSISRSAKWLLLNRDFSSGLTDLRTRYLVLLSERGLAVMSGKVWIRELLPALKDYFTENTLRLLQSDFDEKESHGWPAKLVADIHRGKSTHPLRHLLIINFLGHEAESFFKEVAILSPFGEGPWPCLNPTCSQYKRGKINKAQIVYRHCYSKGVIPKATFGCGDCGFSYFRIGPDHCTDDLNHITRVLEYGPVWEAALKKHWNDPTLDLCSVAKRLGASPPKIKKEAERLGLPFPRRGPGYKPTENNKQRLKLSIKKSSRDDVKKYRQELLLIIKNNPGDSRSVLQQKYSRLFRRLYRYDSQWLRTHMPRPKKRGRRRSKVDRHARDAEVAKSVRAEAKLLEKLTGKPIRITKDLIARKINRRSLINYQLDKLPRTRKALEKVVETRLQFALRRLRWAAETFREENLTPSRCALTKRAGIYSDLWHEPTLKNAIDTVLL